MQRLAWKLWYYLTSAYYRWFRPAETFEPNNYFTASPYFTYSAGLQERADWLYYYTSRTIFYGSFYSRVREPHMRLEIFNQLDARVLLNLEHSAFKIVAAQLDLPNPPMHRIKKLLEEELKKNPLA